MIFCLMKKAFLALIIAGAFVAGSVFAGTSVAFAIQDKTLDSECAKQKHDGLLALLCDSVMNLEGPRPRRYHPSN